MLETGLPVSASIVIFRYLCSDLPLSTLSHYNIERTTATVKAAISLYERRCNKNWLCEDVENRWSRWVKILPLIEVSELDCDDRCQLRLLYLDHADDLNMEYFSSLSNKEYNKLLSNNFVSNSRLHVLIKRHKLKLTDDTMIKLFTRRGCYCDDKDHVSDADIEPLVDILEASGHTIPLIAPKNVAHGCVHLRQLRHYTVKRDPDYIVNKHKQGELERMKKQDMYYYYYEAGSSYRWVYTFSADGTRYQMPNPNYVDSYRQSTRHFGYSNASYEFTQRREGHVVEGVIVGGDDDAVVDGLMGALLLACWILTTHT